MANVVDGKVNLYGRRGGESVRISHRTIFLAGRHHASVPAPSETFPPEIAQRVVRIQALTLGWMSVEAVVSLGAAWMARSPALLGFGGDSAVEAMKRSLRGGKSQPPTKKRRGASGVSFSRKV